MNVMKLWQISFYHSGIHGTLLVSYFSVVLTYSYGVGMAFVVNAEPPKPLIG